MRVVGESEVVASVDLLLRQSSISIGSAPGSTVTLPEGSAAAQHARLRRQGRVWFVEDVPGSPGTYLNGIRVTAPQVLRPGDHIAAGAAAFHLVPEASDPPLTTGQRPDRRGTWLGAAVVTFVLLAGVVAGVATMPSRFSPLLSPLPVTATAQTGAPTKVAIATSPATATATASPTPTRAVAPTATRPPTLVPTAAVAATPDRLTVAMQTALAEQPGDRLPAAMTAVAVVDPATRETAAAFLSLAPADEVSVWVDGLLGTPVVESPSGSIVLGVYSQGMERYDVVRHDLAAGTEVVLLTQASQPALNPAGDTIAYRSWQADALGLYAATADGSQRWILTRDTHPEDGQPDWSVDGAIVAFTSLRYGDGKSRVYVAPAGGGVATAVCIGDYVAWSPSGEGFAYKGCIGGSCGIMLAAADGSGERLITSDASDGAPAWSPDGQLIAFQSSREGSWDVYVARADGSDVQRLTQGDSIETMPEWSRDGRYVAYRSNADGEWGVWAVPAAGGEPLKLLSANLRPGDEMVESLSWLP